MLLYKKDVVSNLRNVSIDDEITTSICKFYVYHAFVCSINFEI